MNNSLYVALAFGFGVGMIIGSRKFSDAPTGQAWQGALILGACVGARPAFAHRVDRRWSDLVSAQAPVG